ncbi:META domain-containing protein [Kribbella sp. NPDC059898]|uniref:META domain-containing protein n=1 Tax=Kribbella sp. NPDC059898 TaxID=3346995 RepID=UPI0036502518
MSTDLEDDLRGTFERAAASVPQSADLTERATTGARRAQRRTWIGTGAAAVAVAAVAVTAFGLAGSQNKPAQPPVAGGPQSAATTPSQQAVTAQTVSGTWRVQQMTGFTALKKARPDDPVIVFKANGTWSGSDGCNGLQGTYSIGQRGAFSATVGPQHMIGCDNVPHTGVLTAAKRVAITGDTLEFFGADGARLASYARAR